MKNNYAYGSLAPYVDVANMSFPLEFKEIFDNHLPLEVEIGFGTGEYMVRLATSDPTCNFLGFEQCAKRVIKTLRKLHGVGVSNVRLLRADAVLGFIFLLKPGSVRRVHCLFPCPWPKKRHAKHRLFQPDILKLINSRLLPGGTLRIVTDQKPYALWIAENVAGTGFSCTQQVHGPQYQTKFEKKWHEAGQSEFYALDLVKEYEGGFDDKKGDSMKAYFVKKFVPEKIKLEGLLGNLTVKFDNFIYDPLAKKGMVQAIVTEDGRIQYLWIIISWTSKGWCVSLAPGMSVLPTEGVQKAVELAYEAVEASGR